MTDLFTQRIELAKALCEAVGVDPNDCTSIVLTLDHDGRTEVVAHLIPRDLRPLTETIRRLELFPAILGERIRELEAVTNDS